MPGPGALGAVRLTGWDAAFAAHELLRAPGHTGFHAMMLFAGEPPQLAELRALVAERWADVPRLDYRLREPGRGLPLRRKLYWSAGAFDPERRVHGHRLPELTPLDSFAGTLLADPPRLTEAGWRLHLISGYAPDQFAVLLQVNHAIADGVSAVILLDRLFQPAQQDGASRSSAVRTLGQVGQVRPRLLGSAWPALRTALPPSTALPYNRGRSADRSFTWVDVPSQALAGARRAARPYAPATGNDICLALVAGALRAAILDTGGQLPRRLCVGVPVNMRAPDEAGRVGNYISHVRVALPLRTADPVLRLAEICQVTRDRRAARYAATLTVLTSVLAKFPLAVIVAGFRPFASPRYVTTLCTAVPPMRPGLTLLGGRLVQGAGGPASMACHGVVFAFNYYRGSYTIGVTADGVHRDFAEAVCKALRQEADQFAAVGGPAPVGARQQNG